MHTFISQQTNKQTRTQIVFSAGGTIYEWWSHAVPPKFAGNEGEPCRPSVCQSLTQLLSAHHCFHAWSSLVLFGRNSEFHRWVPHRRAKIGTWSIKDNFQNRFCAASAAFRRKMWSGTAGINSMTFWTWITTLLRRLSNPSSHPLIECPHLFDV